MTEFRAIAGLHWRNEPDRAFYFKTALWTLDIFTVQDYIDMNDPYLTVNLGIEPDNWSGFTTLPNGSVVPNTDPFLIGSVADYYDFTWNLQRDFYRFWESSQANVFDPWGPYGGFFQPFAKPLPEGDYIIGFTARSHTDDGGFPRTIFDNNREIGPLPWISSTPMGQGNNWILPQPASGVLVPGIPFAFSDEMRWALSLKIDTNPGALVLGDVNLDGVVNLLDVNPFVDLLTSGEFQAEADINQDGMVNLLDVQPFVELLTGG